MKAWFKAVNGLRRILDNPEWGWRLANELENKEMRAQLYETPEGQMHAWQLQLEALQEAHIFEFDDDTALMLTLTDNEPHEVRLPFPTVFLDCEFDLPTSTGVEHFVGVLLKDIPFEVVTTKRSFTIPNAIPATAFLACGGGAVIEMVHAVGTDVIKSLQAATGRKVSASRLARKELSVLSNLVTNFLDLLETPDVMLVPLGRKRMSAKRAELGKPVPPPSDKVVLRPSIRRYIRKLREGGLFYYSHRFWVRGHWRTYRDGRYKGARGRRGWIMPFVKGEGLLVKKRYVQRGKRQGEGHVLYRTHM